MSLYEAIALYDIYYNKENEGPLKKHYEEVLSNKDIKSIHDCSFGTGNLTFVLSDMGYEVSGSDLSQTMLDAAKGKAKDRGLTLDLFISDFRCLKEKMKRPVDLMMSTGNSLPHISNDEIKATLKQLADCIKPGGYLYLDLRNWDKILDDKQRFFTYNPLITETERINLVQVWDYIEDRVRFNLLYTFERDNKIYKEEIVTTTYFPLRRDLLFEALKEAGFVDVESFGLVQRKELDLEKMDWYSVIARKDL